MMGFRASLLSVCLLATSAHCINNITIASSIQSVLPTQPPSTTLANGSTVSNPDAFVATVSVDLKQYWDLFYGPVSLANVTTTIAATPVASSELVPPPFLTKYPDIIPGQQVPAAVKNSSWSFPKGFLWGVASAATQVEGATASEGKGPSIWDILLKRAVGYTVSNDTAEVANNQYYTYKQDIARIAALGVPAYSFSISWPRVLPFGKGQVNELALQHYDDVINTCLEYNVEPIITLFHWDLPLYLQNSYGGWLGEEIVDDFVAYAKIVFSRYGNKIKRWQTINEPIVICTDYPLPAGYFANTSIPDVEQQFYCGHHLLLAHAKAYHAARSLGINGTISLKINGGYKIPLTNSTEDAIATQRAWDFNEGWFSNPIFIDGNYPATTKEYTESIGLVFTTEEQSLINGTADFYSHDAYTAYFYSAPEGGLDACLTNISHTNYPVCAVSSDTYSEQDGGWSIGSGSDPLASWLWKTTDWLPAFLHYIQDTWHPRGGIVISEFGFGEPYEHLKTIKANILTDPIRTQYFHDYMEAVLLAISEGVNVIGTIAWAIADNLEWASGYNVKFGLQYYNYTSGETFYKASFFEYVNAFKLYAEDPVIPTFVEG